MWPRKNLSSWQEPAPDAYLASNNGYFPPEHSNSTIFASNQAAQAIFSPPASDRSRFSTINISSPARTDASTMAQLPTTPRIGLDARAAELKEKLLRSRSQSRANTADLSKTSTDASKTSTDAAAVTSDKSSVGGPLAQPAQPPSTSFGAQVPRPLVQTSLPADANDIAALISSISSGFDEIPGLGVNNSNSSDSCNQPQRPLPDVSLPANATIETESTAPAISTASVESKQRSPQEMSAPKSSISAPAVPPLEGGNMQAHQPSEETKAPAKVSFKLSNNLANVSPKGAELPSAKQPKSVTTDQKSGPAFTVSPSTATNSPPQPSRAKTEPTSEQPSLLESTRWESGLEPGLAAPKPAQQTTNPYKRSEERINGRAGQSLTTVNAANNSMAEQTLPGAEPGNNRESEQALPSLKGDDGNRSLPAIGHVASDDALAQLLNKVPDVKDWLEMTDYYNVQLRTRKLERFRRVKALAAEKLRIEEEERRLMEEEELDMELQRSTMTRLTTVVSNSLSILESSGLLTPATPMSKPVAEAKDAPAVNTPAKRALDEEAAADRKEKVPRLESPRSRSEDADNRSRENDRRDSQHDKADRRPPSPSTRHSYRQSPPTRPREYSPRRRVSTQSRRDHDDHDDRPRKYDRYQGDSGRYDSPRRKDSGHNAVSYPIRVDLGRKGDTRFFIMKSFNEDNVRGCMENNVWTTQVHNSEVLAEAYAKCKNVILFFSINKSRAFQGYARMASAPSSSIPRPNWVKGIHWDTSDPFKVQWLSKTAVEFFRIGHIKNPYNEGQSVLVARDGQEIEEGCGAELLREMEAFAMELTGSKGDGGRFRGGRRESGGWYGGAHGSYGGGSGYGGGGSGGGGVGGGYLGKKNIKREGSVERR
ncbi:hypothetical protein VTI74DRAFT_9959 [Chaetomium olivicolor]